MVQSTASGTTNKRKARWIAFGFVGAFAASVGTVIFTGLRVEGVLGEFDAGFRPVVMNVGEVQSVDLIFNSESEFPEAFLDITLPEMIEFSAQDDAQSLPTVTQGADTYRVDISVAAGQNSFSVELAATEVGRGYLIARVVSKDEQPIGLYRMFVTVDED